MAINDLLTQDEIDALLNGVSAGEFDAKYDDIDAGGSVMPYDFTNQGRIARGRLPALQMVNERFAGLFAESLAQLLNCDVELSVVDVQMLKYTDYIPSLFLLASMNRIRMSPLAGSALCIFDPKLIFIVVDQYFGGAGKNYTKLENRNFAPTEKRMIEILLEKLMPDLSKAWQPVLKIEVEYVNSDVNTNLLDAVNLSELVVVSSFHVQMEGGGADLHLTLPYAMLEPMGDRLDMGLGWELMGINEEFSLALQHELKDAKVEMISSISAISLSLKELNELKVGDIIPMEMPDQVLLKVGKAPLFKGQYCSSSGKNAVKIQAKCHQAQTMS